MVGSGVSGLTAALLLGLNGKRVLLLEKAPYIGGSLRRFKIQGIPYDTGFHFTGGLRDGELLHQMLRVLGLRDAVEPRFLKAERANTFVFEQTGECFDIPYGQPELTDSLVARFPKEERAITTYFSMIERVRNRTHTMDLLNINVIPEPVDEDYVTLQHVLDELTDNRQLQAVLSGFALCYGTPPSEVSFAAHARMCLDLYQSIARVVHGGDAFVDGFSEAFESLDVDVLCNEEIVECVGGENRQIERIKLSNGTDVSFDSCLLTIHPRSILELLPDDRLSRGFIHRIEGYEPSSGFLACFGVGADKLGHVRIISFFPDSDVNALLDDGGAERESALVLLCDQEIVNGESVGTLISLEPCSVKQMEPWQNSRLKKRDTSYYEWKARHAARVKERIATVYPDAAASIEILDAASPLTFRDYLNSPDGSAYGIRQKMGQFNLIGRLPWRNMFAAGQSALLPGIAGAMMSSFIVCRSLVGREQLRTFISEKL